MIEKADQQVKDWISSVVTGAEIVLGLPDQTATKPQIALYLMDLSQGNVARVNKRPPLQLFLRYLVTVWSPRPEDAHRLLGELIFAALEKPEKEAPEFEVLTEPLPIEAWAVMGVAPQPSFFLRVPLRRERPEPKAPLVRAPVIIQPSPMRPLTGVVYGPEKTPIMGARVEFTALGLVTRTNEQGRFHFTGVPATVPLKLSVQAKGQRQEVDFSGTPAAKGDEPLEIRLHIPED
ncbi:MAG TPA: Pvc16 family protein [Blastocatellia bacterium]|nr:Pvc16 family protein [Blastocatellia bacterium]